MVPSQIPALRSPHMASATHNEAQEKTLNERELELRALNNPSFNRIIDLFNELLDEINQISSNSNSTCASTPVLDDLAPPSALLHRCPFLSQQENPTTRIWHSIGDDLQTMGSGLQDALQLSRQLTHTLDDECSEDSESMAASPRQQRLDASSRANDRRSLSAPKPHDGPHWPTVLWTAAISSVLTYIILRFGKP